MVLGVDGVNRGVIAWFFRAEDGDCGCLGESLAERKLE